MAVAAFPVTVGSRDTASPIGHWTVKAIAKLPSFRYDLTMLNEGLANWDVAKLAGMVKPVSRLLWSEDS